MAKVRSLKRAVKLPRSFKITVGVHSDAGPHPSGPPLTLLAAVAEYGADRPAVGPATAEGETPKATHVPARAPIRTWFDQHGAELENMVRQFSHNADALALKLQASIQKHIASGLTPPNAASTIARKGSSKPLIDSGVLRSSYVAKVAG